MNAKVSIRPGTQADWNFVALSFAREYANRHGEQLAKKMFSFLLPTWKLTVVCPIGSGDEIYGWLLQSPDGTIEWAHVKPNYRGRGFFRVLHESVMRKELLNGT